MKSNKDVYKLNEHYKFAIDNFIDLAKIKPELPVFEKVFLLRLKKGKMEKKMSVGKFEIRRLQLLLSRLMEEEYIFQMHELKRK